MPGKLSGPWALSTGQHWKPSVFLPSTRSKAIRGYFQGSQHRPTCQVKCDLWRILNFENFAKKYTASDNHLQIIRGGILRDTLSPKKCQLIVKKTLVTRKTLFKMQHTHLPESISPAKARTAKGKKRGGTRRNTQRILDEIKNKFSSPWTLAHKKPSPSRTAKLYRGKMMQCPKKLGQKSLPLQEMVRTAHVPRQHAEQTVSSVFQQRPWKQS